MALAAALKRENKAFEFKPFSLKQKKVLYFWQKGSKHKDKDIIIADGAIRSGKTVAMICSFLKWSLSTFDGETFIIAGKSVGALKRNVIKPMKEILNAWGIPWQHNRSENYLAIGNNIYHLFGANNEASQDVLQGITAAGALADEVALFPKNFVDQMIGRCSVDDSKVFMNCNPKGPYHWFKTEYIDEAKEKNIYYLHFTMDDNLSLAEKIKERFKRMFSGVFFKRYILGLWTAAEGLIYDMFCEEKHVAKNENRVYTKYYVAVDYGTQNATVFGLWGLSEDGRWYLIKEYYYSGRDKQKQKTDKQFSKDLKEFIGDIKIKAVIVDPSAASFIAQLKEDGFRVKKAKNKVIDGIRLVASLLEESKILFNSCCQETFKEFSAYIWDNKALERGEDAPVKQKDHCMDMIRYFCLTVIGFRALRKNYSGAKSAR